MDFVDTLSLQCWQQIRCFLFVRYKSHRVISVSVVADASQSNMEQRFQQWIAGDQADVQDMDDDMDDMGNFFWSLIKFGYFFSPYNWVDCNNGMLPNCDKFCGISFIDVWCRKTLYFLLQTFFLLLWESTCFLVCLKVCVMNSTSGSANIPHTTRSSLWA